MSFSFLLYSFLVMNASITYDNVIHGPLLAQCGYFQETETPQEYATVVAKLTLMWLVVYVACCGLAQALISSGLKTSMEAVENTAKKLGQRLAAIIKALLVSGIAITALATHYKDLGPLDWTLCHTSTVFSGDFFTAYEIMELIVAAFFPGLLTIDFFLHHLIHILLAVVVRYNCFVGFYADILLAQEISSPFMMVFFICRGRYGELNPVTAVSFVLFTVNFLIWRVGLGSFGAIHWLVYHRERTPAHVAMWISDLVCFLMVAGAVLQIFWAHKLVTKLLKFICPGMKKDTQKRE